MKIYVRYILKNLAAPTFFITVSLVCVVWLTQSLKFIDLIINQGLPVTEFLKLVVLLLPSLFGLVLPIAILCAALYTYNRLNNESEILVLKAAGISRMGIAKPCIILAFITTLIGYSISFYFLPASYGKFKDLQYYFRDNYASLMLEEGIFNNPIPGMTVYVSQRADNDTLKGILIHDARIIGKPVTIMAETAKAQQGPNGLRFLMNNASRQQVDRATGEVSLLYFDSYPFDFNFYSDKDQTRTKKPDELFMDEIFTPDPKLDRKLQRRQIAEAHGRIIWPLNNFALPMMVLAIMLSGDLNRRGQSKRIIAAVGISLALMAASLSLKNIAANGKISSIVMMYVPTILTVIISFYALLLGKNPFRRKAKRVKVEPY